MEYKLNQPQPLVRFRGGPHVKGRNAYLKDKKQTKQAGFQTKLAGFHRMGCSKSLFLF